MPIIIYLHVNIDIYLGHVEEERALVCKLLI